MFYSKLVSSTSFVLVLLSVGMFGCHNNDTTTPTTTSETTMETTTDTTSKMSVTDTAVVTAPTTDTSNAGKMSATTITTSTSSATGTAKPNPAKKGLKGKAVITVPAKGTGAMEMDKEGVYSNVEYLPSFPGGANGLQKFFDQNLQYPTAASDDGIEGTVNVNFIVDENGKLSSPQVQGQAPGYGLEAEALRVIQKMPSWTPGKLKGKNVKTRFSLPVKFQLN